MDPQRVTRGENPLAISTSLCDGVAHVTQLAGRIGVDSIFIDNAVQDFKPLPGLWKAKPYDKRRRLQRTAVLDLFITPTEIRKSFVSKDSVGKSIQLIVW